MGSKARSVVRALLFDDRERILLVHWRDPSTGHEFLEPPGGRRERGETDDAALRREVVEETGVTGIAVGALVAEIDHCFTFAGERYECRERYYACRVVPGPLRDTSRDAVELEGIVGTEWCTLADLAARPPRSLEPPQLLAMLRGLRHPTS